MLCNVFPKRFLSCTCVNGSKAEREGILVWTQTKFFKEKHSPLKEKRRYGIIDTISDIHGWIWGFFRYHNYSSFYSSLKQWGDKCIWNKMSPDCVSPFNCFVYRGGTFLSFEANYDLQKKRKYSKRQVAFTIHNRPGFCFYSIMTTKWEDVPQSLKSLHLRLFRFQWKQSHSY